MDEYHFTPYFFTKFILFILIFFSSWISKSFKSVTGAFLIFSHKSSLLIPTPVRWQSIPLIISIFFVSTIIVLLLSYWDSRKVSRRSDDTGRFRVSGYRLSVMSEFPSRSLWVPWSFERHVSTELRRRTQDLVTRKWVGRYRVRTGPRRTRLRDLPCSTF